MSKLHDIFIDHYGEELLKPNATQMEQQVKDLMNELIDAAGTHPVATNATALNAFVEGYKAATAECHKLVDEL